MTVRVLDRKAASNAAVSGLLISLASAPATTSTAAAAERSAPPQPIRATVGLDYSGFAQAFGGTYGSRLQLVQLPACALTTPQQPACRTQMPLSTRNDAEKKTLTAEVAEPASQTAEPMVLAAVAAPDGSQGDYKATSLSASATWNAGGNSGDFTWSYPMRVPPVPGGLTPDLKVNYSSQSVDGRTSSTNNQPSWVGEGFDLWPGFIERSYKPCADDGAPQSNGIDPGDQCWAYDNATVTWNGKGGELIKASDGTWKLKNDDGTRFEILKGTGADTANGDNDNEYWKVTTTDGTRYYFGKNRLPNWSSGKPETGSTWTAPVFGNNADEPCHQSDFKDSWCQQAWRWNLDYVVDPNGNAISYSYTKETNAYGRNVTPSADTTYVRGGYLNTISYGLRDSDPYAKAPARVTFGTSERCDGDSTFCDPAKITSNPERWPDVPWDQNCKSGDQCAMKGLIAPTFWTRKWLSSVTTQVVGADGTYRDVDTWNLKHSWGEADIDRDLRLDSIQHIGNAGDKPVTLPKVTFTPVQLTNRLDKTGDDIPPFIKYRVGTIYDESGGQIDVNYSGEQCTLSDLPTPETNTKRCFPVYWQAPGHDSPIRDWFHKYVVTQVVQTDRTGGAPDMITDYSYLGDPAWHYDDDDGMTKAKYKTWSQWRGYGQVRTTTGGWNDPRTQTDTYYLRGMDGDRKAPDGGTKSVTVSDGEGGTYTDHEALAGFDLKTVHFDGPGGAVHDKTVNTPWRVQTASRTRSWGTTTANAVNVGTTRTWTAMGGGTWRQTRTDTTYNKTSPGVGRVETVSDLGDTGTAGDDKCTRTSYADNSGANIVSLPSRVETVAVACTATPDRSPQLVSDTRTYYDNGALGAAPSKTDPTKVEEIASHDGTKATYVTTSQTVYDSYGRPTKATDAAGNVTTTAYTDTGGLNTKTVVTSPRTDPDNAASAQVTTTELDPAFGQPTAKIDAAGLRTDLTYDALGRLTGVWQPDRRKAAGQTPNLAYEYHIADGGIVAVTTKTLKPGGTQRTSYELYDGWLRPRQTQADGPDGGRLITDTFYDSRGNTARTYGTYYNTGAPVPSLLGVDQNQVESQTASTYDGLNRVTVKRFLVGNGTDTGEKWRTTTEYGGNYTAVTPPKGGTPTREITDARGQVIERRQYKGDTPTGDYDATTYTYTPAGDPATVTDPAGNTWRHEYDLRGREIKTVDPDKGTSTATFDDLDQETSSTDARGQKLFTRYDALGRKTELRQDSPDGPLRASWTYDSLRMGQPASSTRYVNGEAYTTKITQYDMLDRPTRQTITIPTSQGALGKTYTFGTTYNLDGTVASTGYASGGDLTAESVLTTYDDLGRPVGLKSNLSTYVTDTQYTYSGKPTKQTLDTGGKKAWYTYTWEAGTQRLKTSTVDREGLTGNDRNATYSYDQAGNILSIVDDAKTGIDAQCFTYDHLRRLTQAWTEGDTTCSSTPAASVIGGPAPYWQSYTYDTAGNRKTETLHGIGGQADTTRTYTTPTSGNKLTGVAQTGGDGTRNDSFGYDDAGNMTTRTVGDTTQTLDWDPEGNLAKITEAGNTTSYVYTADGDRLLRKDPTGTTLYLPGTELRLYNGASSAKGTRYYTLGDQTLAMRTGSGVQFLAPDHQGTSQLAIDAGTQATVQRRYTPFGTLRGVDDKTTWPDEKGFVGGTNDPGTGLVNLGAREYDPQTGRFVSVDPLVNPDDDQSLNGYAYANNSPITFNDASGLCLDVNPVIGPISCHAPGNDGKPTDFSGRPNHRVHPYRGTPAQYDPSPYHYRFNPYLQKHEPRAPAKKCDWTCKIKKSSSMFANGVKHAYGSTANFVDKHWNTISKVASVAGFGACLVVSAGACVAVGLTLAGASYLRNVQQAGWNFGDENALRQLAFDSALTLGGGYLGKAIPSGKWGLRGGWGGGSVINRSWGRAHWRHASRTPVNLGRTGYGMAVNASTGMPGLLIGIGVRSYPSLVIHN
ncbi:RHS repeat domain-containing protein [Actinomadura opuntiae]|uniref:RHS repeat domain-containing protein n=1 Tax=Actinomadura sp. OS1-43 TaxID=604315 RepID=UPI00255ADC2D|nr:RHS repeat-associated core domain-containing protein [Actinomadura sp. OS1-43]MDL4813185.1 RHS repeat-associated core domain-containing protein [Actinomadura sp. OS1-43]